MIFSIGYQGLVGPEVLLRLATRLDATVVDVRSVPTSRKRGFGRRQLDGLLGGRYQWRGDVLGGRGDGPTAEGLNALTTPPEALFGHPNLVLMCMEEAPGECHRHHAIAVPLLDLGIDVQHIYRDEIVLASALQEALDDPDPNAEYDCEAFNIEDSLPPVQACSSCSG
jgi:hypothetical protein